MYSQRFGSRNTPRNHAACKKMWEEASTHKRAKGYLILGHNTNLYESGGNFFVTFHGNQIVTYYPEYKGINACGWEGSITTQMRIAVLANVSMHSNSSLGYEQNVRVNGYPYFDNMRIDNYGHVLEDDRLPDYKTVNVKAVVQRYTNLFRRIEKLIGGRYELGEWAVGSTTQTCTQIEALGLLETLIGEGETFLPTDIVRALFRYAAAPNHRTVREALAQVKEDLRGSYYLRNDGYETIEIGGK